MQVDKFQSFIIPVSVTKGNILVNVGHVFVTYSHTCARSKSPGGGGGGVKK